MVATSTKSGLPTAYLVRHGETAWSATGQHTSLTDLSLTERGEEEARALGRRLVGLRAQRVFTSPLRRAIRTCALAGFGPVAKIDEDLVEWNYGEYEGRRSAEIRTARPGWDLFRDGCPGGESVSDVGARADVFLRRLRASPGDALVFSSAHFLRVLAARWLGLDPHAARYLVLSTASLSALGYESDLSQPVVRLWNDTRHTRDVANVPTTG
jgi:probable phosphoglycerate mutase